MPPESPRPPDAEASGKVLLAPDGQSKVRTIALFGVFGAILYLAYFRRFTEFGVYGDDAVFFGEAIDRTWRQSWDYFVFSVTRWPQGRPLGIGFNLSLVPHLIGTAGGLAALHAGSWFFLTATMYAVYRIVSRVADPIPAFAAAVFYGLCPAHTVRGQLTYAYGQISILCACGAIYAALNRRWAWYGAGVAVAMVMAETTAIAALVAPLLLTLRFDRAAIRRAALMIGIWIVVVGAIMVARKQLGDPWGTERVGEIVSRPAETLSRSMESAITGSRTHLELVAERLRLPLGEIDLPLFWTMLLAAVLVLIGILVTGRRSSANDTSATVSQTRSFSSPWQQGLWLVFSGLIVMGAIYAAYFRSPWYPGNWRQGFMSGVHLVPAFGSALMFAGLCMLAGSLRDRFKPRVVQAALLVTTAALLSAFGVLVQRDYADSWVFQKHFWRAYQQLCADAGHKAFVLVLDRDLPAYRFTERSSWTTEWLPYGLFDYTKAQASGLVDGPPGIIAPVVIAVGPEPADTIRAEGENFFWKPSYYFMLPKSPEQQPQPGNVILLERKHGVWRRLVGTVPVDGGQLKLKEPTQGRQALLPFRPFAADFDLKQP